MSVYRIPVLPLPARRPCYARAARVWFWRGPHCSVDRIPVPPLPAPPTTPDPFHFMHVPRGPGCQCVFSVDRIPAKAAFQYGPCPPTTPDVRYHASAVRVWYLRRPYFSVHTAFLAHVALAHPPPAGAAGGLRFNNTRLCAGWRNDCALGSGRHNALLIPGHSGPNPGPATLLGPARRAMPLAGLAQWCPKGHVHPQFSS